LRPAELADVYDHLRRVARRYLKSERPSHTMQATDLVHEAFIRLNGVHLADLTHAAAAGAQAMRRVLVSHARRRLAAIRGGGAVHVSAIRDSDASEIPGVEDLTSFAETRAMQLLDLNEALEEMAGWNRHYSEVVELRFFGGLSIDEVAAATGRSTATVKRDWRRARAWLFARLTEGRDSEKS
jgi:RNA polymerase sigma factor (TIGR02999 family)